MTAPRARGFTAGTGVPIGFHLRRPDLALTSYSPPLPQPGMEAREPTRVPSLSRRHVPRPRLTRALDASTAQAILLIAPAGFGKTSLACEWLAGRENVYWYRATSASADLAAFSVGIAEVMASVAPGAAERLRQRLRVGELPEKAARPLAEMLAEDLVDWPPGAILVVDDYHLVIDSAPVEEFVDWLLTLSHIRLVVASRGRPAWASARRVLYGEILRLQRDQLAMTADEVNEVLNGRPSDAVKALVTQAEGWPAVIGLASLSSLSNIPIERVSDDLLRYFAEEVVRVEPADVQQFMLIASVPRTITARRAEEVLGLQRTGAVIRHLVDRGLLHGTLSGELEFHPLLRRHLHQRLEAEMPDVAESLTIKAASEARRSGRWEEAFELMVCRKRFSDAADILGDAADDLLTAGRIETLEKWILSCGPAVRASIPASLAQVEVLIRQARLPEAVGLAEDAGQRSPQPSRLGSRAWLLAGRAAHLLSNDREALAHYAKAIECSTTEEERATALSGAFFSAIDLEEDSDTFLRKLEQLPLLSDSVKLQISMASSMAAARSGRLPEVSRFVDSLLPIADQLPDPALKTAFLVHLAHLNILRSRYAVAAELALRAQQVCEDFRLGFALSFCRLAHATARVGLRNTRDARRSAVAVLREALARDDHYLEVAASLLLLRIALTEGTVKGAELPSPEGLHDDAPRGVRGEMVSHLALATASIGDVALAQQYVNVARTLTGESYTLLVCSFSELIAKAQAGLDREEAVAALTLLLESVRRTGMPDALVISYRAYPSCWNSWSARTYARS